MIYKPLSEFLFMMNMKLDILDEYNILSIYYIFKCSAMATYLAYLMRLNTIESIAFFCNFNAIKLSGADKF